MGAMILPLDQQMKTMRDWGKRRLPSGFEIPRIAVPVLGVGAVVSPAYGAGNQVQLVEHTVPANYEALFTGIVLGYAGAPAALPGDILYTVDIDRPLGVTATGYNEKDFELIALELGSFVTGFLWPVEFRHTSGEQIRIKGQTVANVGVGGGNFLTAALVGFEWPAREG